MSDKKQERKTLQTYKDVCGEETAMILSVCSNTRLARGLGMKSHFLKCFLNDLL